MPEDAEIVMLDIPINKTILGYDTIWKDQPYATKTIKTKLSVFSVP